ncbi:MAG TPA: hypothetical protein DGB32_03545 [Dehalococcoidia bacterium]|jgi:cytochrome c551/c552|nr:hypothetical protein [Chloroflexota bacterium]HCV27382.1 hypothetical protein [Dehalococcoidia bacterium]|tara:strand:- start:1702 stop:2280 length:579 start_codon:yes stop_codon:yes gene_type:complete
MYFFDAISPITHGWLWVTCFRCDRAYLAAAGIHVGDQIMRRSPFSSASSVCIVFALVLLLALAACSSGGDPENDGDVAALPTFVTISTSDPTAAGADGADESVTNGEAIFAAKGCSACHAPSDATVIGPGLADVGERAATQVSGQSADEYLEDAIRDPGDFVVDGFANLMPNSFADLPESDLHDLIAFLKSL